MNQYFELASIKLGVGDFNLKHKPGVILMLNRVLFLSLRLLFQEKILH